MLEEPKQEAAPQTTTDDELQKFMDGLPAADKFIIKIKGPDCAPKISALIPCRKGIL